MLGRPAIPRASLRFLRSALPPCARFFLLSRRRGAPRSRGRGLSRGSPSRSVGGNGWASQVPGGPSRACPALRPRRDRHAKPLRRDDVAFRNFGTRRLPPLSISGLNHTACALAVYASQPGSPLDHARLASGWGLALAGRVWLPARSLVKFPRYFMASSSPRLRLAHPKLDLKAVDQTVARSALSAMALKNGSGQRSGKAHRDGSRVRESLAIADRLINSETKAERPWATQRNGCSGGGVRRLEALPRYRRARVARQGVARARPSRERDACARRDSSRGNCEGDDGGVVRSARSRGRGVRA